jgi:hypothetical protein
VPVRRRDFAVGCNEGLQFLKAESSLGGDAALVAAGAGRAQRNKA